MAREQFQNLTEPMYYILMSLLREMCGVDIMQAVEKISKGRVKVGPGTLYALLGKFEKENMIIETEVKGRKRSYIITEKGKGLLIDEHRRLISMVDDGLLYMEKYQGNLKVERGGGKGEK
ncbi:PadR family transcriptional regulator [Clostridium sp.]|uniref:PadR family transcriptional regulator n=1 Tax=Clostridium sp. TaxID=1506 RepID=UPI003D6CFDC9